MAFIRFIISFTFNNFYLTEAFSESSTNISFDYLSILRKVFWSEKFSLSVVGLHKKY